MIIAIRQHLQDAPLLDWDPFLAQPAFKLPVDFRMACASK
jgi:hypothetical protein